MKRANYVEKMHCGNDVVTKTGELEMAIDCGKAGGGSDSENKEEEGDETKHAVMSFKWTEKDAVSEASVLKAFLRDGDGERPNGVPTCPIIPSPFLHSLPLSEELPVSSQFHGLWETWSSICC